MGALPELFGDGHDTRGPDGRTIHADRLLPAGGAGGKNQVSVPVGRPRLGQSDRPNGLKRGGGVAGRVLFYWAGRLVGPTLDSGGGWSGATPALAGLLANVTGAAPGVPGDPASWWPALAAAADMFGGTAVPWRGGFGGEGGAAVTFGQPVPADAIKVRLEPAAQQTSYSCGPAALLIACRHFGIAGDEADFAARLGTDPEAGTPPPALVELARRLGLTAAVHEPTGDEELCLLLDMGLPVVCCLQAWGRRAEYQRAASGHYVVACGYDADHVYYADPSLPGELGFLPWGVLEERWHDKDAAGTPYVRWGLALSAPEKAGRAGGATKGVTASPIR